MSKPDWFDKHHKPYATSGANTIEEYERRMAAIAELEQLLISGCNEREFQGKLKLYPELFHEWYRTGHGNYAWAERALGSHFQLDWLHLCGDSGGGMYIAFELEDPQAKPFKKKGEFTAKTQHGIAQILEWRRWLMNNLDYAMREPTGQNGLGLDNISPNVRGVVVAGRREIYQGEMDVEAYNARRKQEAERNIEILSYESFLEALKGNIKRPPTSEEFKEDMNRLLREIGPIRQSP